MSIIKQTKYGDTIFVSQPLSAASAMVTWAVEAHGLEVHSLKLQRDGYVKVSIPGLTTITYAPEGSLKVWLVTSVVNGSSEPAAY